MKTNQDGTVDVNLSDDSSSNSSFGPMWQQLDLDEDGSDDISSEKVKAKDSKFDSTKDENTSLSKDKDGTDATSEDSVDETSDSDDSVSDNKQHLQQQSLKSSTVSRSQKRIIDLVSKNKEKDAELEKLRNELIRRDREKFSEQHREVETRQSSTKEKIDLLKKELIRAKMEGNVEVEVDVTEKLQKANVELMALDSYKKPHQQDQSNQTSDSTSRPTKDQIISSLPKEGQKWVKGQSWFMVNERVTKDAVDIAAELENEGFSPEEQEYYAELESRMADLYPKRFGKKEQDKETKPKEEDVERTVIKELQPRLKSAVAQGSRTNPTAKAGKIRLEKSEVELARKYRIPLEVYAEEKRKIEEAEALGSKVVTFE